jgi:hypothetical protein
LHLHVQLDRTKERERKNRFTENRKRLYVFFHNKKVHKEMGQDNTIIHSESLKKLDVEVNRRLFLKYQLKVERCSGAPHNKVFEQTRRIMAKKLSSILLDPKQGLSGQSIVSLSSKERSGILKGNKSYKESRKMFQDSKPLSTVRFMPSRATKICPSLNSAMGYNRASLSWPKSTPVFCY